VKTEFKLQQAILGAAQKQDYVRGNIMALSFLVEMTLPVVSWKSISGVMPGNFPR